MIEFKKLYLLNLKIYKVNKCDNINNHNYFLCPKYHSQSDRRRDITKFSYSPTICKNFKNCNLSDLCKFSHSNLEYFYHPKNYKTKFCYNFFQNEKCEFLNYCSYAHSIEELRIEILDFMVRNYNFYIFKYKSHNCPFTKFEHNKSLCIYSHCIHDFKRKNIKNLKLKNCNQWDLNFKENYKKNCKKSFSCNFCHGFKELDYHPLRYKTKKCNNFEKNECFNGHNCHFYHKEEEKRVFIKKNELEFVCKKQIIDIEKINRFSEKLTFKQKLKKAINKKVNN